MLGTFEAYTILDKVATDKTEFFLFNTKSYVCENSLFIFFCCLDWVLEGAKHPYPVLEGANQFISQNFHVRKEYDSFHSKPDLATLDGMTTIINTCFFT